MSICYSVRFLEKEDYHRGYLDVINIFTRPPVYPMSYNQFCERVDAMCNQNSKVFVAVWHPGNNNAESKTEVVVGTAKVLLEYKMHNNSALMGHVEDVVVHPDHRGKGIAQQLVNTCLQACRDEDCYKVVLSCKDELLPLYLKLGFKETGRAMTVYHV